MFKALTCNGEVVECLTASQFAVSNDFWLFVHTHASVAKLMPG